MQNVVWPMMIVINDRLTLLKLKNDCSAIPVMMPGSASGSTRSSETASRPKNLNRWTANAAAEPRTSAMALAANAALSDSVSASRTCSSCQATENQLVV